MNFLKRLFRLNQPTDNSDFKQGAELNSLQDGKGEIIIQQELADNNSEELDELNNQEKVDLIERLANDDFSNKEDVFGNLDPLLKDAARLIVKNQIASTALIQRRMKLGYNRAGRIMDQLEIIGVVGPNLGAKPRVVCIKTEVQLDQFIKNGFKLYKVDLQHFSQRHKEEIDKRRKELQEHKVHQLIENEKDLIRKELLEKERKRQLQREVFKELIEEGVISNQSADKEWSREPIPQDVMDKVWNRDGGRCVKCGSQENLEFDHIIPFSKGGANTYRNLQILCKKCNLEKSNKIG